MLHGLLPPAAIASPGKILTDEEQIKMVHEENERAKSEPYRPSAPIGAGEMPLDESGKPSEEAPMFIVQPPIPAPRAYKGSSRPAAIWPEIWSMMTPRQRAKAIHEHETGLVAALPMRHEAITNKRIERYGPSNGCEACLGDKSSQHAGKCRERFDALIAKEKGKWQRMKGNEWEMKRENGDG